MTDDGHRVRRTCHGCGAPVPGWPVIAAACPACIDRLPPELRAGLDAGPGWVDRVDAARAWLAANPSA